MSRLRCPLRTPGVLLGKAVDAGADTGADRPVSMGCGMAFGAMLGFAGKISAIFDGPIVAEAQTRCCTDTFLAVRIS